MTQDTLAILEARFDRLVECHHLLIRKLCWARCGGDPTRCAELVQDCYIALWRRLPDLRPDATARQERSWVAWLCRSVLSHRLRRRRHWWLPLNTVSDLPVDDSNTLRRQVEELATGLAPREQLYLRLYLDGYSNDEIARELDIAVDSVYKMRHRVIERMKHNANPNNNGTAQNL